MDRLHVVILTGVGVLAAGVCGAVGCGRERDAKQAPAAGGRVDAVQAGAEKKVTADEFCDTRTAEGVAPDLALPALAGGKAAPARGTWRWINVWATWCKPCIEEMPQLVKWHKDLGASGTPFDLVFVSVDDSDDLVTSSASVTRTRPTRCASPIRTRCPGGSARSVWASRRPSRCTCSSIRTTRCGVCERAA